MVPHISASVSANDKRHCAIPSLISYVDRWGRLGLAIFAVRCCVVSEVGSVRKVTRVREGLVRGNGTMISDTGSSLYAWRTAVIVFGELRTKCISSDDAL